MGFFQGTVEYLKSTKKEVKNINWPTRRETVRFTLLVLAVSAATAVYLSLFDFVFLKILERFVF